MGRTQRTAHGAAPQKSCMSECPWGIRHIPCTMELSPHPYHILGPAIRPPGFQLLVLWEGLPADCPGVALVATMSTCYWTELQLAWGRSGRPH